MSFFPRNLKETRKSTALSRRCRNDRLGEQKERLTTKLDDLAQQYQLLQSLRQQELDLQQELEQFHDHDVGKQELLQKLQKAAQDLLAKLNRLQRQQEELQQAWQQLQDGLDPDMEQERNDLKRELGLNQTEDLQTKLDQLQQRMEALEPNEQELWAQLDNLQNELSPVGGRYKYIASAAVDIFA